jgi:hypothetical protein
VPSSLSVSTPSSSSSSSSSNPFRPSSAAGGLQRLGSQSSVTTSSGPGSLIYDKMVRDLQFLWESSIDVPQRPKKPLPALAELVVSRDPAFLASVNQPRLPLSGATGPSVAGASNTLSSQQMSRTAVYGELNTPGWLATVRPSLSTEKLEEPAEPSFFDCLLRAMEMRGIVIPPRPVLPRKPAAMSEARYAELVLEHCHCLPR